MQTTEENSSVPDDEENRKKVFSCCICLDTPSDPVITPCGHLFCWNCLVNWLDANHDDCPVCRGHVTRENVTPIYGAGTESKDPRQEHPHSTRPQAHYEESNHSRQNRNQENFFNMFNNFQFPGFVHFNYHGGNFSIGTTSPIFLIGNLIYLLIRQVMQWWNSRPTTNGNNQSNPNNPNNPNPNNTNNSNNQSNPPPYQEISPDTSSDIKSILFIVAILFIYMVFS